jgi:hypothetical protein
VQLHLRSNANTLSDEEANYYVHICNCLRRSLHESDVAGFFSDWLYAVGWTNELGNSLYFDVYDPETDNIRWLNGEEEQGARFMLLELLALAVEDGAL